MKYGYLSISLFFTCQLMAAEPATSKDELPKTVIRQATNLEAIKKFEQSPTGWKAGFQSVKDWKAQRGFTPESQASEQTGIGWFSVNGKNRYKDIQAPGGADYVVFEGQHCADHTQLHGVEARKASKAGEEVASVDGAFDMTVAFQDDGSARVSSVLNAFFQIFERSKEKGWCPAYALFFEREKLLIGAWDDRTAVPHLTLKRGEWYRIRLTVTLKQQGAVTVVSVWPISLAGKQGEALVSGIVIEHRKGLQLHGLARSFPVLVGSYTWCVKGKEPFSAATLMCAYSQDTEQSRKDKKP
jgi:hypothetical protein